MTDEPKRAWHDRPGRVYAAVLTVTLLLGTLVGCGDAAPKFEPLSRAPPKPRCPLRSALGTSPGLGRSGGTWSN